MPTGLSLPTASAADAARADEVGVLSAWSAVGGLERIPRWLNLIPMVVQWLWLSLRYGSMTLPSSANPAITSGGLVGEGKTEYFRAMGRLARAATATSTSIVNEGVGSLGAAEGAMREAGLDYPLIVKPDIGWCGHGVRLVRDPKELKSYLAVYQQGERVVLQRYVPHEGEAGILYVRHPSEASGRLLGVLLRYYPRVVGDGRRTIAELMAADPRLRRMIGNRLAEPCCDVSVVPAAQEIVRIATIGSFRVGGMYRDGSAMITPALSEAIDAIAKDIQDFHVGRFDVRYESLSALRDGRGFVIIEVNGAGSEAVHAWEPSLTLRQSYGIIFDKQRQIFAVGDAMRKLGHKPIRAWDLAKLFLRQEHLIKRYPPSN